MDRSLGFGSISSDCVAQLRASVSLRLPYTVNLATEYKSLPIIQKVRRHGTSPLRLLVRTRFQDLFHSPLRGSFRLSLTVLVHYRSARSI